MIVLVHLAMTEAAVDHDADTLLYEVAQAKATQQLGSIAALDDKVGAVVAFASGLIAAQGIIFPLGGHAGYGEKVALGLFLLAGLGTYGYALWEMYHAFRPRHDWDWRPNLDSLIDAAGKYSRGSLALWTACEYRDAINENRSVLKEKADRLHHALIAIGVEAIIVAGTGFVTFLAH